MDKQILMQLYKDMYQAMIDKDIKTLTKMHHPSFTLTHMTGTKQTREQYFRDIRNDQLGYRSVTHDEIIIDLHDDHAKLIGHSRVRAAVYGGQAHVWRLELRFDCQKIEDQWFLMNCIASTY